MLSIIVTLRVSLQRKEGYRYIMVYNIAVVKNLCLSVTLLLSFNLYCQQEESVAQVASCETKLEECKAEESNYNSYRLSRYKDLYVIVGSPDTKIQVSLKYQITSYLKLYFGYTQIMFWEIGKDSAPFRDINFNPDLFYRIGFSDTSFVKAVDLGLYEHKSNGKDGLASRSWNSSYLRFYTIVKFHNWSFNWDTKFYWYYRFQMDNTNSDIREYSGFWKTRVSFINYYDKNKNIDRISFYFEFFPGGTYSQRWNKGGQELGIKFRVGGGTFYPSIFLQLYHGYNESLLDYNKEHSSYRVGIAF